MREGKPSIADILKANRKVPLAVLAMPLVGMAVVIGLIVYLGLNKAPLYIAIIFFLMVQYGVLLVYINGRFNAIINRDI